MLSGPLAILTHSLRKVARNAERRVVGIDYALQGFDAIAAFDSSSNENALPSRFH